MSGIVGIVHLDGRPVDTGLLGRMTRFLTPRGPDAQRTWVEDNAGFGHALLITDPGVQRSPQPCTVDGRTWITADARLDARDELLERLRGRTPVDAAASDPELILHAYKCWNEACLDHLFGEYVFAVWDSERCRLFCAHDQLGTRPLYFAHLRDHVVFSNTLECVRQHPAVSAKINDAAIGDFLLFGLNYNPETTSFADIRRLPPGHFATWDSHSHVQRRYWQMPIDEPLFYRRRHDYVDQFQSLLKTSVKERLPADKVGVCMSGGLDSALLAAVAHKLKRELGAAGDVFAVTYVYDRLIEDRERHYSGLVARHLGILQHLIVLDSLDGEEMWSRVPEPSSEPASLPWTVNLSRRDHTIQESLGRVYFYGEGPDNALHYEWRPYLAHLIRGRRWNRLLADVSMHLWVHRHVPLLATLPKMMRVALLREASVPQFPDWLNPEFCSRLNLEERWRERRARVSFEHPTRPYGYRSFKTARWQHLFERCDSSEGQSPVEFRHPYLNLPLLRFMLAVPALPWCRNKYIQRVASRGLLPVEILRRPKTPLSGFPELEMAKRKGIPAIRQSGDLQRYILPDKIFSSLRLSSSLDFLRSLGLSYWLHDLAVRSKRETEKAHGTRRRTRV